MPAIRRRPRMYGAVGILVYLLVGFTTSDLQSLEVRPADAVRCPLPASEDGIGAVERPLTVLQGNSWMLPSRPLLLPRAFSVDREERLERLVETIRACRPTVVLLQEVFETSMVRLLGEYLSDYEVVVSEATDITGTFNASGLVTLSRLPVVDRTFGEFGSLPPGSSTIEALARKGWLAVRVESPVYSGVLLNLHLYASRDAGEVAITERQLAEVLAWVEDRGLDEAGDLLVGGDFNLPAERLRELLPRGWGVSAHGPTFEPGRNPYTVQGSNDTPAKHRDLRAGVSRTIDFMLTPAGSPANVRSIVLDSLLLSDHHFLHHTVVTTDG